MNSVLQLLNSKAIPWTKSTEERRLVIARPVMESTCLPMGARLSARPLKGKRIVVKNQRKHANQRLHVASWPQSNQHEIALPKLACIMSGSADYLLGNYCLHADEGSFILVPPGSPHHCRGPFLDESRLRDGECLVLFAYAYSQGILVWFSRSAHASHIHRMEDYHLISSLPAVQILNLLTEESTANESPDQSIYNSYLFIFFTLLRRELEAGRYVHPGPIEKLEMATADKSFAGQVQEYIEANLHKPLRVADAAAHMYMSVSQFSRRMRQESDCTFVELLIRCRIERAQRLLVETDWTVSAITSYVSFRSTGYFHDLFHQHVGCTPIEYRLKNRS